MRTEVTRQALLDAARRLFVRYGFNDVSMSDIAKESGKGRRTLYTYYDSKADIYKAVIDAELEKIIVRLEQISKRNVSPDQKILDLVYGRFRILQESVSSNGTLRSFFFRDIWGVEHFRKDFDRKEKQILISVISEGKAEGVFNVQDVRLTAEIFQYCMRGFEVPYIQGHIRKGNTDNLEYRYEAKKLIWGALGIQS